MVGKKGLFVLGSALLLMTVGCSAAKPEIKQNKVAEVKAETKENKVVEVKPVELPHMITRENEFIDTDKETVKFLFKTDLKSSVEIYIGESADKLQMKGNSDSYDNKGIKISGLIPGKEYFYTIVSKQGNDVVQSKVNSFKKLDFEVKPNAIWPKNSIFYELLVRSFYDTNNDGQGDFKGVTEKLDYIKELGANAIWLMPMMKTPSYHGYDVIDYYAVEPEYGTMADFEEMIKKSHEKGIKVIIDLVINHASEDNKWFKDALKGGEYRDYFIFADKFDDVKEKGEWQQELWSRKGKNYYYAVFWSGMPDFNYRNPKVRTAIKDVAKFWIDKGVDGFRLDASKHIDDDADVTHSWWKEFNSYVKSVNPDTFLVGEAWDNYNISGKFFGDMDSTFNFSMQSTISEIASGTKNGTLVKDINDMAAFFSKYKSDYTDSTFTANHDINRIGSTLGGDTAKEKLAATILLTIPGTPFLYYGEELGMKGEKPDEYIREPMEWYADTKGEGLTDMKKWAFATDYSKPNDGISVEEEQKDSESLLNYYKKVIKIRKENPILFNTLPKKVNGLEARVNGYDVEGIDYTIRVIYNLNKEEKKYDVNMEGYKTAVELLSGSAEKEYVLKPSGVIVLKLIK